MFASLQLVMQAELLKPSHERLSDFSQRANCFRSSLLMLETSEVVQVSGTGHSLILRV